MVYDRDRWEEDFSYEMRYRFKLNGNGNQLGYHMTDMFAIRSAFKRHEVIMRVATGWRKFEPYRLIQSQRPWFLVYNSGAVFKCDSSVPEIIEDESFIEQILFYGSSLTCSPILFDV